MTRVVVVDDEQDLLDIVSFNLRAEGHEVLVASNGVDGLELIRSSAPDVVVLDLMLPDVSGTEICRRLRDDSQTRGVPILVLSARGGEIDRVVCFELGADDYMTKPFSLRELMLRVKALIRRSEARPPAKSVQGVTFGALRMDYGAHRVWVADDEVTLTALEFKLLRTLFERKNRVQTRESLLEHVWGFQAHVSTRTVDAHVKRLREKLGDVRDYVQTVRGVGYRFVEESEIAGHPVLPDTGSLAS